MLEERPRTSSVTSVKAVNRRGRHVRLRLVVSLLWEGDDVCGLVVAADIDTENGG